MGIDSDDRKTQQNKAGDNRVTEDAKAPGGGFNDDHTHHDDESENACDGDKEQLLQR
jgi:hypothetical protein